MKKITKIIIGAVISLFIPLVAFASAVSVDRLNNDHIEPLIKSDFIQASYFNATTTTPSIFPYATTTSLVAGLIKMPTTLNSFISTNSTGVFTPIFPVSGNAAVVGFSSNTVPGIYESGSSVGQILKTSSCGPGCVQPSWGTLSISNLNASSFPAGSVVLIDSSGNFSYTNSLTYASSTGTFLLPNPTDIYAQGSTGVYRLDTQDTLGSTITWLTFKNSLSTGGTLTATTSTLGVKNLTAGLVQTSSIGSMSTLALPLGVSNGGTGASTFGQGWMFSSGGTTALNSSTSPTVAYITATSTTASSTFANGIVLTSGCVQVNGSCATGGGSTSPGGTNTQLQINNGGSFAGTTTSPLYVGRIVASSTTASILPYASTTAISMSGYSLPTHERVTTDFLLGGTTFTNYGSISPFEVQEISPSTGTGIALTGGDGRNARIQFGGGGDMDIGAHGQFDVFASDGNAAAAEFDTNGVITFWNSINVGNQGNFDGSGNFSATGNITAGGDVCDNGGGGPCLSALSDPRLKKNIQPLSSEMDKFMQLKTIQYNWNDIYLKARPKSATSTQISLDASVVSQLFPEATYDTKISSTSPTYKSLNDNALLAVTIKTLQEEINNEQADKAQLQAEIDAMPNSPSSNSTANTVAGVATVISLASAGLALKKKS